MIKEMKIALFIVVLILAFESSPNFGLLVGSNADPAPPFPKQYSSYFRFTIAGSKPDHVFVDLLDEQRVRIDVTGSLNFTVIDDIKTSREYIIYPDGNCICNDHLRNPYVPFIYFPFNLFKGVEPCYNRSGLCNIWDGCHPYEIPPAPFNLQATQTTNEPIFLNFPSIGNITVFFDDYNTTKPPSYIFSLPKSCTVLNCTSTDNNNKNNNHYILSAAEKPFSFGDAGINFFKHKFYSSMFKNNNFVESQKKSKIIC